MNSADDFREKDIGITVTSNHEDCPIEVSCDYAVALLSYGQSTKIKTHNLDRVKIRFVQLLPVTDGDKIG